jgi:flagellar hook assembly protein FlgD
VITVSHPESGRVSAEVFDVRGRLVARLADRVFPSGDLELKWDGTDLGGRSVAAGGYLYRIRTDTGQTVGRLVVSR